MPVPALTATNVSKTFGESRVLRDFDLVIEPGEIHALVGENGSGKSTFIKILAGYHAPDVGSEIAIGDNPLRADSTVASYELGCRVVHQDLGLVDELSILDNLSFASGFPTRFGTIRTRHARQLASESLSVVDLDFDPAMLVGDLGAASKTGVAVARALRDDPRYPPRLLVLDEPTATMPDSEVEHLLRIVRRVASSGIGVLYVSHRLDEVFSLCDRVTVLRDGRKVASRDVKGLDRHALVDLLVGTQFKEAERSPLHDPTPRPPVLRVHGLVSEDIAAFDLEAAPGVVTGIAGITGSGRETVLGAIFGGTPRLSGTVDMDGVRLSASTPVESVSNGLAFVPGDRKRLGGMMDLSARENMTILNVSKFWKWLLMRRAPERREVADWFAQLSIRPTDGAERMLSTFSGGNQQKLQLAKWMRIKPRAMLIDEPTQGVDVGAKALIHTEIIKIARSGVAVVVASSEAEELAALCDRVLVMRHGRIAEELTGKEITQSAITRASLKTDGVEEP